MKQQVLTAFCILALLVGVAATANAALVNGGFENGNLTGWDVYVDANGDAVVATSYTDSDSGFVVWDPMEGDYLSYLVVDGSGSETTLSQTFSLAAGDVLTGYSAYDYNDYFDGVYGDDYAYVSITDETTGISATLWSVNGAGLANFADVDWTPWSFTAESDGLYSFVLGALNVPDDWNDSVVLLDGLQVNGGSPSDPVPEPATMLLLGSGLMGLAGASRRKFKK